MKRLLSLLLAFTILFSLCACDGSWDTVDLKDPIEIPTDGIIQKSILEQIKDENAIGVFTGKSGELKYDWTIFGSDLTEVNSVNLLAQVTETADGHVQINLHQLEAFGFTALLSLTLTGKWDAQSATAYAGLHPIASVSITGSNTTILNLILDGSVSELIIRPDPLPDDVMLSGSQTSPSTIPTESGEETDNYLSKPGENDGTVYTDGKDKYLTDPIPEGKPKPVEPEDQEIDTDIAYTCTFSIECSTILNNLDMLDPGKLEMVPSNGVILAKVTVTFYEGESVFDVLQRVCRENSIHMEASWTPIYNSAYVEGIHNLYEFDCGALSGWMYRVNGWYPNYGCSRYQLKDGDVVEWRYTCDLGNDVGRGMN